MNLPTLAVRRPITTAMILVSILLFGKLRQPLIIWLVVPLAIIGILPTFTGMPCSLAHLMKSATIRKYPGKPILSMMPSSKSSRLA